MNATVIGKPIKRREDERFLRGQGRYVDDLRFPGETHAYFLRSPHAHARIRSIDTSAALAAPGVLAVFTGEDLKADNVGSLPCGWLITDVNGEPMKEPPHPPLAQGKVRYVGDHVAVVIAESYLQAKDAAELIEVDYEELPAVTETARALAPDAALASSSIRSSRWRGAGWKAEPAESTRVAPSARPETSQFHIIQPQVV